MTRTRQPRKQHHAWALLVWYWELAIWDLAQGSVLDHVLAKARKTRRTFVALQIRTRQMHLLQGRIRAGSGVT